ncbi:MAG: hypothetical protein ABI295_10235 [Xanthomarina sp.]
MEEVTIYEFQLKTIIEALRLTKNIYVNNKDGETCYDRQVKQAYLFAENALKGEKDKKVNYMGNK